jgi:hypothetical protein
MSIICRDSYKNTSQFHIKLMVVTVFSHYYDHVDLNFWQLFSEAINMVIVTVRWNWVEFVLKYGNLGISCQETMWLKELT